MSYVKIMVHCVWGTKNRVPVLTKQKRYSLIEHIKQNAIIKNIHIDCLNGYMEHLHALISMGGKQNIADIMQLYKGGSSLLGE